MWWGVIEEEVEKALAVRLLCLPTEIPNRAVASTANSSREHVKAVRAAACRRKVEHQLRQGRSGESASQRALARVAVAAQKQLNSVHWHLRVLLLTEILPVCVRACLCMSVCVGAFVGVCLRACLRPSRPSTTSIHHDHKQQQQHQTSPSTPHHNQPPPLTCQGCCGPRETWPADAACTRASLSRSSRPWRTAVSPLPRRGRSSQRRAGACPPHQTELQGERNARGVSGRHTDVMRSRSLQQHVESARQKRANGGMSEAYAA